MKKIISPILVICFAWLSTQAQNEPVNPFEKYGYTPKIATLSKGKYVEFYDQDTIVQIGGAVFNTVTMKIMGFVEYDTIRSEYNVSPEVISRWLSPDPLSNEFPSWSPYNYVENNPINLIDPTGMAPDKITLNNQGVVTNVEDDMEDNTFYTEDGTQLMLNDPSGLDKPMLTNIYEKGDVVFNNISKFDLGTKMKNTSSILYHKNFNLYQKAEFAVKYAWASYNEYDFSFTYFKDKYNVSQKDMGELYWGKGYVKGVPYTKFEGSNTLYNLPDAGNFMWGLKARLNLLPKDYMLDAAGKNEGGSDTDADTKAITEGYEYIEQ